ARTVLVQANGRVNQRGAVADYLEVEAGYERAVEACLGELLQHVIGEQALHAAAGLPPRRGAGGGGGGVPGVLLRPAPARRPRGPAHAEGSATAGPSLSTSLPDGAVAMSSVLRVGGLFADAIRHAIGDAAITRSYEAAAAASRLTALRVVTLEGDVFRGP